MAILFNHAEVDEFVNTPLFARLVADSGYKSVGVKVVEKDKVVQELTASYKNKKINFKDGIKNPDFVVVLDYKFLKSLDKKKLEWIKANPMKAYLKYHDKFDVPFFVKLRVLSMMQNA
ncbi:MAG: hypothetical protein ABIH63_01145 [archaeon]